MNEQAQTAARAVPGVRLGFATGVLLVAAGALLVVGGPAAANHGYFVDFGRIQIDCRSQASRGVTSFMEMDSVLTWDAAAATFSGAVYNVPRTGARRQQVGTMTGRTTATAVSFTIKEDLTHEGSATFPAVPQDTGPRATPMTAKLSGPVTVRGRTGDTFACTWSSSDARLSTIFHATATPVATATAASAARTFGPEPAPAAQIPAAQTPAAQTPAGGGLPIGPIAAGGLLLIGAGALVVRGVLARSAGANAPVGGTAAGPNPRQRFADRLQKPIVVGEVGDFPTEPEWREREHLGELAKIEARVEGSQRDADLHDMAGALAGAGELGAKAVGIVADQGVSTLKEFTGPAGKVVDATYAGVKGTAGALAEGKGAAEAIGQGVTDVLKGQVSDKVQDAVKGIGNVVAGSKVIEVPDAAKKKLGEFAQDVARGGAAATAGITDYVGGQLTGAVTDPPAELGIDEIAKRTGLSDGKPKPGG